MLAGRIPVNVKLARRRKARRSTGSTNAQNGTKLDTRFQRPSESWSKKQKPQRRCGSGKGVWSRTLSVNAYGKVDTRDQRQCSRSEERCTQLCSLQLASIVWWRNGKIVKNSSLSRKKSGVSSTRRVRERSIEQSGVRKPTGYRCMRCGRGSKHMKMLGRCNGPKFLSKGWRKW